ncbi:MAG: MATE family efflux transporter, partial [Clostridia bacterium]|nr:MATE family efflux transporter [Clostridia bacterium]
MSRSSSDFGVGSVWGNIMRLAVPMILAQLINVLYSVVDRIYVGHIPGASAWAMTGIGLVLPIISIITAFSNLFGMGGAPLFAMARGAKNTDRAAKIMGNTFSMLIITAAVLSVTIFVFKKPLLYLFGASDVTYPYARDYLNIYILGTVFVMISLGMNGFINAQGFGVIGMLTVSIGAVMNLILDPIFIFVFKWGVKGAAAATVAAQFVSAMWVMRFVTGKKAVIRLEKCFMPVDIKLVKEIASLGLAGFIMAVTNGTVQMVCNSTLYIWGGDIYVSVMTVINSVREIMTLPAMGLTSGAQPVISFNYGAKKYDRVKSAIKFMTLGSISISFA